MALNGKVTIELGIHTPAAKFFHLFSKQIHHVQNITDRIHEGKVHQGEWHGIGSAHVKHWTLTIDGKVFTCKQIFEHVDEQNKSVTCNLFDGDVGKQYKTFKVNLQVTDKDDGGAVVKWTIEYEKLNNDVDPPFGYLEFVNKVTRDADGHLLTA